MESILISIRKLMGCAEDDTSFDGDLLMHINSVFAILNQIGVGPPEGFVIEDETASWDQYIEGKINQNFVKSYMYLKVKMLFDPPASATICDVYNRQIDQFEWRLRLFDTSYPPVEKEGDISSE